MQHSQISPDVNRKSTRLTVAHFIIPRAGEEPFWPVQPKDKGWCNCQPHRIRCPAKVWVMKSFEKDRRRKRARDANHQRKAAGGDLIGRLKRAFSLTCQYCGTKGSEDGTGYSSLRGGPQPWTIDRIDPAAPYAAGNVTLACMSCNTSKHARPLLRPVRSLADMEAAA